jgi:hypothetical protein
LHPEIDAMAFLTQVLIASKYQIVSAFGNFARVPPKTVTGRVIVQSDSFYRKDS